MNGISLQERINKYYTKMPNFIYNFIMNSFDVDESRARLFEKLDLKGGQKVLEVACGTGLNFKHYPKGLEYYAIDINQKMLRKAKKEAVKQHADILFFCEDIHTNHFADRYFDAAIITFGLSAIPDNYAAFNKIANLVCEKGQIGILDMGIARFDPEGGQTGLNLNSLIKIQAKHFTLEYYYAASDVATECILKVN